MPKHDSSVLFLARCLLAFCALASAAGAVPVAADRGGWANLPTSVYRGCEEAVAALPTPPNTASTSTATSVPRDRIAVQTQARRLASFSIDEASAQNNDAVMEACWRRLDGVWRADDVITLDPNVDTDDWAADNPSLRDLAHGNYTRPQHLIITTPGDPERALMVADVFNPEAVVRFVAADSLPFDEVFVRSGPRKRYVAQPMAGAARGRPNPIGDELFVDVTRRGQVRVQIGLREFFRPRSAVAKSSQELRKDDAFLISYNMENLAANRRGYDVVEQDPFFLLKNPKRDVFARVDPRRYTIDEKRIVPLGLTLVQEVVSGMIYRNSLETTEEAVQKTAAQSFGLNLEIKSEGVNLGVVKVGTGSVKAGYKSAKEETKALVEGRTVARATAFSRSKLYTMVVDHPYSVLSDSFVNAIDDALRRGDGDPRLYQRIIERFGTHYPYAVTYGAAAKVTRTLDQESFLEAFGNSRQTEKTGGGSASVIFGASGDFSLGKMTGRNTSNSGTFVKEGASFVAVGGNGSWDQNGFSPGQTPYPILLDLRPLHELLNPLTFPGEPEIYIKVRERLKQEIATYLETATGELSTNPFRPLPRGVEGAYRIVGANTVIQFSPSENGDLRVGQSLFRRMGDANVYRGQNDAAGTYTYFPSGDALLYRRGKAKPAYLTKVTDTSSPECATVEPIDGGTRSIIGGRVRGIYSETGSFEADLIREFRSVGASSEWLQFRYRNSGGVWTKWTDWREVTPGSYMPVGGSNVFTIRDGGNAILFTSPGSPGTRPLMLYRVNNPPDQCPA